MDYNASERNVYLKLAQNQSVEYLRKKFFSFRIVHKAWNIKCSYDIENMVSEKHSRKTQTSFTKT